MTGRTALRPLLKAAFGLLLVAILLYRMDLRALGAALARYDAMHGLVAATLFLLACLIAVVRWQILTPQSPFMHLTRLNFVGQFYAIVLPGQLAGEVVKAWRLAKGRANAAHLAASVVVDRIVGTIALLLVASGGAALSPQHLPQVIWGLFLIATFALICSLLALQIPAVYRFASQRIARLENAGPRSATIAASLHRLLLAWHEFGGAGGRLTASLLLGIVFQMFVVCIYALLADNLQITLALADWAWIAGIASLAVLLPVSIGGIGLREGALLGCLRYLHIDGERAIALSLGIFALMLFGALIGGILELRSGRAEPAAPATGRST